MSAQPRQKHLNPFYIEQSNSPSESYDQWDDFDDDDEEELGLLVGRYDTHQDHYAANSRQGYGRNRYGYSSSSSNHHQHYHRQKLCRRRMFLIAGLALLLLLVLFALGGESQSQASSSVSDNQVKNNTDTTSSTTTDEPTTPPDPGSGKDIPKDDETSDTPINDEANNADADADADETKTPPINDEVVEASKTPTSTEATAAPGDKDADTADPGKLPPSNVTTEVPGTDTDAPIIPDDNPEQIDTVDSGGITSIEAPTKAQVTSAPEEENASPLVVGGNSTDDLVMERGQGDNPTSTIVPTNASSIETPPHTYSNVTNATNSSANLTR